MIAVPVVLTLHNPLLSLYIVVWSYYVSKYAIIEGYCFDTAYLECKEKNLLGWRQSPIKDALVIWSHMKDSWGKFSKKYLPLIGIIGTIYAANDMVGAFMGEPPLQILGAFVKVWIYNRMGWELPPTLESVEAILQVYHNEILQIEQANQANQEEVVQMVIQMQAEQHAEVVQMQAEQHAEVVQMHAQQQAQAQELQQQYAALMDAIIHNQPYGGPVVNNPPVPDGGGVVVVPGDGNPPGPEEFPHPVPDPYQGGDDHWYNQADALEDEE